MDEGTGNESTGSSASLRAGGRASLGLQLEGHDIVAGCPVLCTGRRLSARAHLQACRECSGEWHLEMVRPRCSLLREIEVQIVFLASSCSRVAWTAMRLSGLLCSNVLPKGEGGRAEVYVKEEGVCEGVLG